MIYNWGLDETIGVDVSSVLQPGDRFEIRNAQDFFGPPVRVGTYNGEVRSLPMAGLAVVQPVGYGFHGSAEPTGPHFNAFVLIES